MNKKGFTLIELLAIIVILGIILVISVPNIMNVYENSKLKTEQVFLDRLSQTIDGYVTLNSSNFNFQEVGYIEKNTDIKNLNEKEEVVIFRDDTKKINDVIESTLLLEKDYKNPGNKDKGCNKNASIEIYRDADYVYCYRIKAKDLDCLTDNFINSIGGDGYAVNTCSWETIIRK